MYWRIFRIIGQTNNLFLVLKINIKRWRKCNLVEKDKEQQIKSGTNLLITKVVEWIFEDVLARIWCAR